MYLSKLWIEPSPRPKSFEENKKDVQRTLLPSMHFMSQNKLKDGLSFKVKAAKLKNGREKLRQINNIPLVSTRVCMHYLLLHLHFRDIVHVQLIIYGEITLFNGDLFLHFRHQNLKKCTSLFGVQDWNLWYSSKKPTSFPPLS